ncbi:MAG: hypothetical protein ACP5SH_07735 [Syntrophobacteraceae bacterium]
MMRTDSLSFSPRGLSGAKDRERPAGTGGDAVGGEVAGFQLLDPLIREGALLKREIEAKTARLRSINLFLAENASFKDGRKSACLRGGGYKVKIRLHEIISWDQEKIREFRKYLPEEKFTELFQMTYEPTSKKAIDGFLAHADKELANGLQWCMSVKSGAPHLTYEKLD